MNRIFNRDNLSTLVAVTILLGMAIVALDAAAQTTRETVPPDVIEAALGDGTGAYFIDVDGEIVFAFRASQPPYSSEYHEAANATQMANPGFFRHPYSPENLIETASDEIEQAEADFQKFDESLTR